MAWRVVDSNFLGDPTLEEHLAESRSNRVVITGLIQTEMFKNEAELTARKATAICCRYPAQVVILRAAETYYGHRITSAKKARALVDLDQMASFPSFCTAASLGTRAYRSAAAENERVARDYMAELEADTSALIRTFQLINDSFTRDERAELRLRTPFSRSTQRKLLDIMMEVSKSLFVHARWPDRYLPRTEAAAINTFVFRYAMCMTLLFARWVEGGRQTAIKPARLVNDVIDMHTAAIGTFYAGVLSRDRKLLGVHTEARFLLRLAGAYVG